MGSKVNPPRNAYRARERARVRARLLIFVFPLRLLARLHKGIPDIFCVLPHAKNSGMTIFMHSDNYT